MDERPVTISVVVATYGSPYWSSLASHRAIPSVAAQETQPLELLVRHRDSLHEARNEAARAAEGDWLCFLDADDELDPCYLWHMHRLIETMPDDGKNRILVPSVQRVFPDGPGLPQMLRPRAPMTKVNRVVVGALVRRSLFLDVGGFQDWALYEDWDLWLSCLEKGAELVDVPDSVYRAWVGESSRNSQPRALQVSTYDSIRAAHGLS